MYSAHHELELAQVVEIIVIITTIVITINGNTDIISAARG